MDVQRIHRARELPESVRPGTLLLLLDLADFADESLERWLQKRPASERPPVFALVPEHERMDPEQELLLASRGIGLLRVSRRTAAQLREAPQSRLAEELFAAVAQLVGAEGSLSGSLPPLSGPVQEHDPDALERIEQYAREPFPLSQDDEQRINERLSGEDIGADWS
jgi:hypothetical protein